MPTEGRGRLFRRKDSKFLIYLPKSVAEDSMFPFTEWESSRRTREHNSIKVKVSFEIGKKRLIIEPWTEPKQD